MATAAMPPSTFDLKSQATYPIRLGASILNDDAGVSRYTSVRYNHRPRLQKKPLKATISAGSDVGISKLSLESDDGPYAYEGRYLQNEDGYVLVCKGEGKDKEMVLERMSNAYNFNLARTPTENNAAKLASKYRPLTVEEADEGDLFGDGDEDMPADESNPFDYRHFLKAELEAAENVNGSQDTIRSTAPTPHVKPLAARGTPVTRPAAKKRKPAAVPKANPKRVKAGQEPSPEPEKVSQKPKPSVPKLRMDRKASIRRPSIDLEDSGELILENETPISEKPPKHSMALALGGQLGTGPISLRSAASSPGHVRSPAQQAEPEQVYEFELGDSSPEPEEETVGHHPPHAADEEDAEADEDDDADVDDLELPSPAQTHRQNVGAAASAAVGDDDDDLDKQLALAMMEDDDGSEESEEE